MKVIYIAGPYRAPSEWEVVQNIRQAEKAALFVWSHGAAAICPHKNTALFGGYPGCPDQTWLEGDCEILLRCDAVFAIDNWRDSSGARDEVDLARMNNIPVLFTYNEVIRFVKADESESKGYFLRNTINGT
jgi:hypothetical protein